MSNIEQLEASLNRMLNKENVVYFLIYDSKNNPRASIKYIYDMALTLKNNGYIAKLLVEDKNYTGVDGWLGDTYKDIETVSIKDDKVEIRVEDVIVVPEHYSNTLPQLSDIRAVKIMLVQQKEYIFETLSIGSKWKDFGFDKCITTTKGAKDYIAEYFPEALVHVNPPFIDEIFHPATLPAKPFIAISCRDRLQHRKFISEFYLKYPTLRWITFRDMVQMSYEEFSYALRECMVSLWVDDESTFGTFPLESMKTAVPVIGKIPYTEPDWLGENGIWTYDGNKLVDLLAEYVIAWLNGMEMNEDVKEVMKNTVVPYTKEVFEQNTLSIFSSLINIRLDSIKGAIAKFKTEE